MATIWKGSITFGLVNVPVELRTAVRADHISFRLLNAEDQSPVKYQRVDASTGEEVPWSDIVKGYEYAKGKFIVLTDSDFKAAALESSKTIDICDFVPEQEIDPRYFETPYFVVAAAGGERAYALLREAMRETGSVAVGKIIMRDKQHLAGLHVVGDALIMEVMRFENEVVGADEYKFPPAEKVKLAEKAMAIELVKQLAGRFEPGKYTDDYRANLMRIINAKAKGKTITLEAPPRDSDDGKVLDLMSRLQASLDRSKGSGGSKRGVTKRGATKGGGTKRAVSKRVETKRSATKVSATNRKAAKGTRTKATVAPIAKRTTATKRAKRA